MLVEKWEVPMPKVALLLVCLSSIIFYSYVSDKMERRGNVYPIMGDCSWWRRRLWFWTQWNQDFNTLCYKGYEMVPWPAQLYISTDKKIV